MSVKFSVQTVRELKGPALSIMCLLALSTLPVTQEWLERNSGYTDKPVSQALAYLRETGRIARTSQGWMLADGVQLPLLVDDESRNFSDSVLILETSPIQSQDDQGNNNNRSRNFSDSEIWGELAKASVMRNERTERLVLLPHITLEYVRAKRLEFKGRMMGGYQWAGLLIRALENNEPVVEREERKPSFSEQQLRDLMDAVPVESEPDPLQGPILKRLTEIEAVRGKGAIPTELRDEWRELHHRLFQIRKGETNDG